MGRRKSNSACFSNLSIKFSIPFRFSTDYALEFPLKNVTDYVHIWGMPNLTEFTVCFWMKSKDPSHGTPFSYAVPDQANELLIIGYDNFNVRIGNTLK